MLKSRMRAAALVTAGLLAGGVTAATITATAANNDSSSRTDSDHDGDGDGGHNGEKALTGADLAKAKAVAEKAVPGGKIDEAETDSGDAVYEVHMTKSDGTEVTVKMDKAFALKGVESGKGK